LVGLGIRASTIPVLAPLSTFGYFEMCHSDIHTG